MSTFTELVEASREAAADPAWLGSAGQLELLSDAAGALGVDDVGLRWHTRTFWETSTRTIDVERGQTLVGPAEE